MGRLLGFLENISYICIVIKNTMFHRSFKSTKTSFYYTSDYFVHQCYHSCFYPFHRLDLWVLQNWKQHVQQG